MKAFLLSYHELGVPIGTTAMIIAHYAVKTGNVPPSCVISVVYVKICSKPPKFLSVGYLSGSPKYGSLWKVLGKKFKQQNFTSQGY